MTRFLPAVLLIAAAPLFAQTPPRPGQAPSGQTIPGTPTNATIVAEPVAVALAGFDADQDGLVTRAEVAAGAARSFAAVAGTRADLGYIGWSDWALRFLGDANALPSPMEVDADHDDRITAAEVAGALQRALARFDRNKDGTLSRAELVTIRATVFGSGGPPRKGGDRPAAPPPR